MSAQPKPLEKSQNTTSLREKIDSRKSEEIVIGFISPIGCGLPNLFEKFKSYLEARGYEEVITIKLSNLLKEYKAIKQISVDGSSQYKRYRELQESGRMLRHEYSNLSILAEYAANEIAIKRKIIEK